MAGTAAADAPLAGAEKLWLAQATEGGEAGATEAGEAGATEGGDEVVDFSWTSD